MVGMSNRRRFLHHELLPTINDDATLTKGREMQAKLPARCQLRQKRNRSATIIII